VKNMPIGFIASLGAEIFKKQESDGTNQVVD